MNKFITLLSMLLLIFSCTSLTRLDEKMTTEQYFKAMDVEVKNLSVGGQVSNDGLVGEWLFDGNANDTSGNGNHGTVNGATLAADRNGKVNSAYSFDGVDDYITATASILSSSQFTWSFWLKDTISSSAHRRWLTDSYGAAPFTSIRQNPSNQIEIFNGNTLINSSSTAWKDNSWHHFILQSDGVAVNCYMDSTLIATGAGNRSTGSSIYIGGFYNAGEFTKALIDDVRIYNRALTVSEIKSLYNTKTISSASETNISWSLPDSSLYDSLEIGMSPDVSGDAIIKLGKYETSYSFTGLEENVNYTFTVRTVSKDGYKSKGAAIKRFENMFTLTFNSNGSTSIPSREVGDGTLISAPDEPVKDGFKFDGWYENASLEDVWDFTKDTITADTTLYAKWLEAYEVKFESNGGSAVETVTYVKDEKVVKPADPTRTGYLLDDWYKDAGLSNKWDFDKDKVTADITLYAKWLIEVKFRSVIETGGTSGSKDSVGLILTFDIDPTTLSASNITITGATKGALSGNGTTRTLAISAITVANGETVSVVLTNPAGYAIGGSPKTAVVYKPITFQSVVHTGGRSGTIDSTGLILTFDGDPTTLSASNITITGATKGALSGNGTTRMLVISAITVANGETVSVEITNPTGYNIGGSPKTAVVYKDTTTPVTFLSVVQTGGTSGTINSTGLILTFDVDPTTLSASNIKVTGATKGALSGSGTTRTLAISAITVANGETVSVEITNPTGYSIGGSPKRTEVYNIIGSSYQGGKIAYIFQPGDPGYVSGETHGLIASIADLSTGIQWYNGSNTTTGATGTALGTGQANTTAIVNNQGAGSYAAKLCNDYTNTDTGTGVYSDWFLPSKDELIKIYNQKLLVGFSNYYWSSSESDSNSARQQHFYEGGDNRDKASYFKVRAVRAF